MVPAGPRPLAHPGRRRDRRELISPGEAPLHQTALQQRHSACHGRGRLGPRQGSPTPGLAPVSNLLPPEATGH